jgi:flavorubredoxin
MAVVIYHSTFDNTHVIAEAIAVGLHEGNEVIVVPVSQAERRSVRRAAAFARNVPVSLAE